MAAKEEFLASLSVRLRGFFKDQAAGLDVPPGHLYRLEGRMELAQELGLIESAELRELLVSLCREILGEHAAKSYLDDQRIILHLHMKPAPVTPSTRDD